MIELFLKTHFIIHRIQQGIGLNLSGVLSYVRENPGAAEAQPFSLYYSIIFQPIFSSRKARIKE